jgi:ParB family chromosome partitioning protein
MAFDIMSLNRNRGAVQQKSKADEQAGRGTLKYIDVGDLVPSENNFYSMPAIEELASLIELAGGVKQPGLAVPMGGGKYKLLAGHRRRLASIFLVEQGKKEYRQMPCMVEEVEREEAGTPEERAEADELREIDEEILLIATNGQREKTDWDKVQEATRLRELLERKRKFRRVPGKTRELIAKKLGTTPAQVGRYESISKRLLPDFKEEMQAGKLGISVAYELSALPERAQKAAFAEYVEKGALSIEDVKRRRQEEEARQPTPGQITMEEAEREQKGVQPPQKPAQAAPVPQGGQGEEPTEKPQETPQEGREQRQEEEAPVTNSTTQGEEQPQAVEKPEETRCVDGGICPYCGGRFDAAAAVNYSTLGTQTTGPVNCPQCGKPLKIFCSVEYFCSAAEEG